VVDEKKEKHKRSARHSPAQLPQEAAERLCWEKRLKCHPKGDRDAALVTPASSDQEQEQGSRAGLELTPPVPKLPVMSR
ncbi:hypothetical protein DV515_00007212, partial [Chloebia gouldiae]